MTQQTFLTNLLRKNPKAIIIGSLGTICNDLDKIPHKHKIPVRGAMGCVMGVGLGYALSTRKKVIVVIGDGSFLMKAGSVATVLQYKPKNLEIYIIDNGQYASVGGQKIHFNRFPKPPKPFKIIKTMV
jgi:thiamine pyrophosphate-dependent acetolactate synthase large subunit-like protein